MKDQNKGRRQNLCVLHLFASIFSLWGCSGEESKNKNITPNTDAAVTESRYEDPPEICHIDVTCDETIPDEPKTPCEVSIRSNEGNIEYDGWAGIELRGRSSRDFAKKQYGLELWSDAGATEKTARNLFDMGEEQDWILNGAYVDRSFIRNTLLFAMFRDLGDRERYTAESVYCDLTLNEDFQGIYILSEKIKRDKSRVDIPQDSSEDGNSFIVKNVDQWSSSAGFKSVEIAHGDWSLVYPHKDRATSTQVAGASNHLQGLINAVRSGDTRQIFERLDFENTIDFILLEEFAKNVDGFHLSIYLAKEPGSPFRFVPWDFDLSFGQPKYGDGFSAEGWIETDSELFTTLRRDSTFQSAMRSRWQELRRDLWSDELIFKRMDYFLKTIEGHVNKNNDRWPLEDIQFLDEVDNLYPIVSHADEIQKVRSWIQARLSWMDGQLL